MTKEHYNKLKQLLDDRVFNKLGIEKILEHKQKVIEAGKCKDIATRLAFDILWGSKVILDKSFNAYDLGYNDSHLETALKHYCRKRSLI